MWSTSGVSIGPKLFLIHINDVAAIKTCSDKFKLADDATCISKGAILDVAAAKTKLLLDDAEE